MDLERWLKVLPAWALYTLLGLAVLGAIWLITLVASVIGLVLKVTLVGAVIGAIAFIVITKARESGAK